MKRILITGISGQDGSYMAEYCLGLPDTLVFGMLRRTAQIHDENFRHLRDNPRLKLVRGDLLDAGSLDSLVQEIKPDYFINLAAQSFVGDSWKIPEETFMATAVGVLKCLEAVRKYAPHCRIYNAGSSEEFGDVLFSPQTIKHPFRPRSPYGAAKCAAHHLMKVYRESYNLYAIQGVLYNHECLTANTPVILLNKNSGLLDIKPISEIVPHHNSPSYGKKYTTTTPCEWMVWDGNNWSEIKTRTATWNDTSNDKRVIRVQCLGGYYEATENHKSFKNGKIETPTKELKVGDELEVRNYPQPNHSSSITADEAELLGLMTAGGYVDDGCVRFASKDPILCSRIKKLWKSISCGYTSEAVLKSKIAGQPDTIDINLLGDLSFFDLIREQIYTKDGYKRVPQRILNASEKIMVTYLEAYKKASECFITNSPVLAAGIWYLMDVLRYSVTVCSEERGPFIYFKLNINSDDQNREDIKKITKLSRIDYEGWLFDLETDSQTFSAGIGRTWVHNSERRGEEFVTRKISKGFARIDDCILFGRPFSPIQLGNIYAVRDWSHAADFVKAIWMMLNQDQYNPALKNVPEEQLPKVIKEYIVASGESHSIKEFIDIIIRLLEYDATWVGQGIGETLVLNESTVQKYNTKSSILVSVTDEFYRPADVNTLLGCSDDIRTELGWSPSISFDKLVKLMLSSDKRKLDGRGLNDSKEGS